MCIYYTLCCLDIQHEDSGNYTCEVNGPSNALLGAVTHYIYVRGIQCTQCSKMLYTLTSKC